MNTHTTPPAARPSRWRRVLRRTFRIAIAGAIVLAVAWTTMEYLAARDLNRQVEKIRAAGEPISFAQLARSYPRPAEDEDAGRFYGAAILLQEDTKGAAEVQSELQESLRKGPLQSAQETLRAIQPILDRNTLALQMVDRGAAMSGCLFDMDLRYGMSATLAKISQIRSLARLCSLRTLSLAVQGHADQAARAAVGSLAMSRVFEAQPALIVHLTRVVCLTTWAEDVTTVLQQGPLSDTSLVDLDHALCTAEQSLDLKKVWIADRVDTLEILCNLWTHPRDVQQDGSDTSIAPSERMRFGGPFLQWMAVKALEQHSELIVASSQPWPAMIAKIKNSPPPPPPSLLSCNEFAAALAPSFNTTVIRTAECLARLRTTRTAIQVERYRLAKGALPNDLQEVVAALHVALPDDPFTGKSLLYRKMADGYAVYSLGESREDMGAEQPNKSQSNIGVRIHGLEHVAPQN